MALEESRRDTVKIPKKKEVGGSSPVENIMLVRGKTGIYQDGVVVRKLN